MRYFIRYDYPVGLDWGEEGVSGKGAIIAYLFSDAAHGPYTSGGTWGTLAFSRKKVIRGQETNEGIEKGSGDKGNARTPKSKRSSNNNYDNKREK